MSQVTLTFEVDEELQAEIAKLAKASNRTAAQLLRDAAEDYVRREREEVEQAVREADDPATEWVPHETVKEDMARQRAEILARIKAREEVE